MALEMSISTLYTMMKQEMDKQAALITGRASPRERKGNNVYIKNNKVVTKPKGNEKRKRETSISPATQNQHVLGDNNKNILAPAKLHRTDPFAYMRSRSHSLTETTTPKA
ncbi:unnamed protein product [Euphydryas editha]|uniref:Uncharacterized protein n=1 Tax=Euphydryas editha TaxID=104508 RepID=A0AAU9UW58_EUPED|nr:unnamed protein product [Euphydryas editha]